MWQALNLTGNVYGRWSVVRRAANRGRFVYWLCRCECGNEKEVRTASLRNGDSTCCGCVTRARTHGLRKTDEYTIWANMIRRCTERTNLHWQYYGGRGIQVCTRWRKSFADFYSDVGARPSKKYSLDRIDNNGNYEPGNVRWANAKEQANNQRPRSLRSTCKRGHADWYQVSGVRGRRCRTCNAMAVRRYKLRHKT